MNLGWYALALCVASKYYSPHRSMRVMGVMTKDEYDADHTKEDFNNMMAWRMHTKYQYKRAEQRRKNKLETLWRRYGELENEAATADRQMHRDSMDDWDGRHHGNVWCRGGDKQMDVSSKWFALHNIRKARGVSAAAVAMAVGISSDRYVRLEKNELKNVKPEERAMIAAFFGIREEFLFREVGLPSGHCSRMRRYTMPKDELEKMLAEQFGSKIKPIKKAAQ